MPFTRFPSITGKILVLLFIFAKDPAVTPLKGPTFHFQIFTFSHLHIYTLALIFSIFQGNRYRHDTSVPQLRTSTNRQNATRDKPGFI